jgi:hypothetical protein
MSFLRHGKIYQSDKPQEGRAYGPTSLGDHRSDESSAGYSFAGCSPAEPTSASPTATSVFQQAAAVNCSAAKRNLSLFTLSQPRGPLQSVPDLHDDLHGIVSSVPDLHHHPEETAVKHHGWNIFQTPKAAISTKTPIMIGRVTFVAFSPRFSLAYLEGADSLSSMKTSTKQALTAQKTATPTKTM